MCRRECLLIGEECEYKAQCQEAEKRAEAQREKVQEGQEAGMEWRSSAHITRYSA